MTQVWVVRHGTGLYLFKDLDTAEASIKDTYKAAYSVEKGEVSDQSFVFTVTQDGNVQDRIVANVFDVHEYPTVMPHVLFPEDDNERQSSRVRKEF